MAQMGGSFVVDPVTGALKREVGTLPTHHPTPAERKAMRAAEAAAAHRAAPPESPAAPAAPRATKEPGRRTERTKE